MFGPGVSTMPSAISAKPTQAVVSGMQAVPIRFPGSVPGKETRTMPQRAAVRKYAVDAIGATVVQPG